MNNESIILIRSEWIGILIFSISGFLDQSMGHKAGSSGTTRDLSPPNPEMQWLGGEVDSLMNNEQQIITSYLIDGAMGSSGGGRVRELSVVCLHNNAIVARGILVTILHCGTPELRLSAIYIVGSVGTALSE